MLDYVKPSQELIGILEDSFKSNEFRWIHVGSVRNITNADTEDQSEASMKNIFRRHTCCFLQRIETILDAFLSLSYENFDPATQDRSSLVLTREYAHLYLDHIRRYCSIAGNEDPTGFGSEVIYDMDKKYRNEWQEAAASTNGIPTKLGDIISEELNSKMPKTEFINKVKDSKHRNSSEGVDTWGVKRVWKHNNLENLVTAPATKSKPKKKEKDNWEKQQWSSPKKDESQNWKKGSWSNKRPSQTSNSEPNKKQKQDKNKGIACPYKEQCR